MRARKGAARNKAKKRLFRAVEGFVGGRRHLLRTAKETLLRAGVFALGAVIAWINVIALTVGTVRKFLSRGG